MGSSVIFEFKLTPPYHHYWTSHDSHIINNISEIMAKNEQSWCMKNSYKNCHLGCGKWTPPTCAWVEKSLEPMSSARRSSNPCHTLKNIGFRNNHATTNDFHLSHSRLGLSSKCSVHWLQGIFTVLDHWCAMVH